MCIRDRTWILHDQVRSLDHEDGTAILTGSVPLSADSPHEPSSGIEDLDHGGRLILEIDAAFIVHRSRQIGVAKPGGAGISSGDLPDPHVSPAIRIGPLDWRRVVHLSLIHISEPTRLLSISYAVFCLK